MKIVTEGPERVQAGIPVPGGHESWELYDMENRPLRAIRPGEQASEAGRINVKKLGCLARTMSR